MKEKFSPPELLTPGEVRAALRIDPKTLRTWADMGKIPVVRTLGGHRRYYRADVDALLRVRAQTVSINVNVPAIGHQETARQIVKSIRRFKGGAK